MTDDLTAGDVVTSLRHRYGCETDDVGPEWAALNEMDLAPGYSTRRIDLLMVRAWSGKRGHVRHAIEVKVSRGDLNRELADEAKWRTWWEVVNRCYLAVPASLDVDPDDLPDEWGLYVVGGRGTRKVREAPRHDPGPMSPEVWIEAFRRASRA